jgi:hypothetical protein
MRWRRWGAIRSGRSWRTPPPAPAGPSSLAVSEGLVDLSSDDLSIPARRTRAGGGYGERGAVHLASADRRHAGGVLMRTAWRSLILAGVLAVGLAAPALHAQEPTPPPPAERDLLEQRVRQRMAQVIQRQVGLTDEQMRKLGVANRKFEQQQRDLFVRERQVRLGIRDELELADTSRQAQVSRADRPDASDPAAACGPARGGTARTRDLHDAAAARAVLRDAGADPPTRGGDARSGWPTGTGRGGRGPRWCPASRRRARAAGGRDQRRSSSTARRSILIPKGFCR